MKKRIVDKKKELFLFSLCWIVYFTSYIGRLNYSSVMSVMIDEGILSLSQAGLIGMIYFFAYGFGQLANGVLGDKMNPRYMICVGLVLSALANFVMGFAGAFLLMALMWGINGYAQAMLWPPMIRIFAERFTKEAKTKYSINIASSLALGTLTSYFLSACMMKFATWHAAFYLAATLLLLVAFIWTQGYGRVERFLENQTYEIDEVEEMEVVAVKKSEIPLMTLVLESGLLVLLFPVVIHGILKDGMTQWVPTFIYERFDVSASFSVIVTMVLPLINLTGAYMAGFVDKRHRHREILSSTYFFGIATLSLILLYLAGTRSVLLTVLLFAVITAVMMAVNTIFINLVPLNFEAEGKVSTVSGFLNAAAYLGSAISTFVVGVLIEHFGWDVAILGWIIVTAAAFVCVLIGRNVVIHSLHSHETSEQTIHSAYQKTT
jgi:OPA family glycerol-3-phosphate transporter-like MFS transporter